LSINYIISQQKEKKKIPCFLTVLVVHVSDTEIPFLQGAQGSLWVCTGQVPLGTNTELMEP